MEQVQHYQPERIWTFENFLTMPEGAIRETSIEQRAAVLKNVLELFSMSPLVHREAVMPSLQKFVMMEFSNGKRKPPTAVITTDVVRSLADPQASRELQRAADLLPRVTYRTNQGDEVRLWHGTYEICELAADGSIRAHAVNRVDGGYEHTSLDTLARFSLWKALEGHHLLLAQDEVGTWNMSGNALALVMKNALHRCGLVYRNNGDWRTGTDAWDNLAYFERHVGLDWSFIGNSGRMGGSGIEITAERIKAQSAGYLNTRMKKSKWHLAGVGDREGCATVHDIRERLRAGASEKDFVMYRPLPVELDTERWH